jgi:hypothetical protein
MYSRPILKPRNPAQRKSNVKKFDSPTAGWISNRNLASPNISSAGGQASQGAAVLDNWFPTATTVVQRRGKELYATLVEDNVDVTSLFSYVNGLNRKLFASSSTTIYDITSVLSPFNWSLADQNGDTLATEDGDTIGESSTTDKEVFENALGGEWIVVQFSTSGGVFLIGVNGASDGFIYDGIAFYPYVSGGVWALSYDNETSPFVVGEVITGGTSGATGTIVEILLGGGLVLSGNAGDFEDNETLTGSLGGAATASSASSNLSPGVTFPNGLTTANMAYVWVYRNRLWFIEKDSLNAYYMDNVDSIGGAPEVYPLGGIIQRGGDLTWGEAWSLSSGAAGGLSDQMVICSSEGEVAVFQGTYPEDVASWTPVGVYRIGTPLGKRAHFRGGGDIAVATSVGLIPLSKAISLDVTALSPAAVSYNIQDAWQAATDSRGLLDWQCEIWPERKMAVISPPSPTGSYDPVLFISNTETGAWCRYTNWDARCMEVFQGQLYFGGPNGKIYRANVTGMDENETYTSTVIPLFDDMGQPSNQKVGKTGRGVARSKSTDLNYSLRFKSDFNINAGSAPSASPVSGANAWGSGVWGQAVWGGDADPTLSQKWKSIGGYGYACSMSYQITSGSLVPMDAELIRLEMTFTMGEVGS